MENDTNKQPKVKYWAKENQEGKLSRAISSDQYCWRNKVICNHFLCWLSRLDHLDKNMSLFIRVSVSEAIKRTRCHDIAKNPKGINVVIYGDIALSIFRHTLISVLK